MGQKNADEMRDYMRARRARIKQEMRNLLGGICVVCGVYDGLEFDHVDRTTKLFNISGRGLDKPRDVLLAEVQKCQLLCKPHHTDKTRGDLQALPRVSHKGDPAYAPSHGNRTAYEYYACRCEPCREAKRRGRRTGAGAPAAL